jgi:hypothetical protein
VLSDLRKQHPEIEGLIGTVRFPDSMGRTGANTATPVVTLEGWLQIPPLLPVALSRSPQPPAAKQQPGGADR